jgi:heme/copper-type cytochrome/quinol oxidase subunit 4
MYQIRTEQIEFVIQSDELTDQFVFHLAVHQFIVHAVAITRLGASTVDEQLQLAYVTVCNCARILSTLLCFLHLGSIEQ